MLFSQTKKCIYENIGTWKHCGAPGAVWEICAERVRRCKFWDLKNASAWPPVVLAAGGGVRAKVGVGVYSSIGNSTSTSSSSSSSSSSSFSSRSHAHWFSIPAWLDAFFPNQKMHLWKYWNLKALWCPWCRLRDLCWARAQMQILGPEKCIRVASCSSSSRRRGKSKSRSRSI